MLALARAGETFETNYSTGSLTTERDVVLRRGTFPNVQNIYYHNGNGWIDILVGPGHGDMNLSYQSLKPVRATATYSGNVPPVGREFQVQVPSNFRVLQFVTTQAAKTEGPYLNANCEISAYDFTIRYGPGTGSSGRTVTLTPPVYISFTTIEGMPGIIVDNGFPDADGDGIPDNEDPDDDNDGRPDDDDAFPNDPDEKDDTDGDGIGDNADPDDDNDGHPDGDDAFPTDPDRYKPDADNDGHPDDEDAFPNNPGEWADDDDDGVGNNQDPDDNSPPEEGGGSGGGGTAPGQGDGDGNPGIGDGGGGPGPLPDGDPDNDDDEVATQPGDTSGQVLPDSKHDVAGLAAQLAPAIEGKLGEFRPLGTSVIPRVSAYVMSFPAGQFGTITYTFNFDTAPWTHLRTLMLIIVVYVVGRDLMKRLTI